jgi:hypothetical protein
VIHRMLWWKKVLSCAAMQARCCWIHRMLCARKGVLSQAAKLAVIHRMPGGRSASPAMQARCCCDLTECSVQGRCAIPRRHARCCHDPQNGGRRVLSLRCHAARCCCDSQNALWKKVCYPCAAMQAAVMIHRMLWKKQVCYPAAMHARS